MRTSVKLATLLAATMVVAVGAGVTTATAAAPAPAFALRAALKPTYLAPGREGALTVLVTNVGGAPTNGEPLRIADTLPHGLTITRGSYLEETPSEAQLPCENTTTTVTCADPGSLPGQSTVALVLQIHVLAEPGAPESLVNTARVGGGGAVTVARTDTVTVASSDPPFGLDGPLEADLFDAAGAVDTQAAAHPSSDTTGFVINSLEQSLSPGNFEPVQELKDVVAQLPPGLIGDPLAAPSCPEYLVGVPSDGKECPPASIVGSATVQTQFPYWKTSGPVASADTVKPVFNVTPERGHPAQFAFIFEGQEAVLYASLAHTGAGYVVQVTSKEILPAAKLTGVKLTFFGDPVQTDNGDGPHSAFFTNPADCAGGPSTTSIYMDSRQNPGTLTPAGAPNLAEGPGIWKQAEAVAPAPTGCNELQFDPEFEAKPTSEHTNSPSGLNVDLKIPQNPDPEGLATPELKNASVTLPAGLEISPSSANGLAACSEAQFAKETTAPASCPAAAQVGTVTVHTPILAKPVAGQVFVGTPECGPCSNADAQSGRMVRLLIQLHSEEYGVTVKIPGNVSVNPRSGQLTATFTETPQLPFDKLEFDFKNGERAPLSTPAACGSYTGNVDLTPWSAPYTKDALLSPGFSIGEGCGAQGFTPAFTAGTASNAAGTYSPLRLSFARSDSQQDFDALEATLPPGLLAKIAGVPRCGEGEANAGACPESSRIGTVTVSAGPGSDPYTVTGQVYLTGPYNGRTACAIGTAECAPFGEVVEVPAVAGPFNLGTVVVRGSIRINPTTAQASVVSNPFPSILDGIPLQVRTVEVTLERPGGAPFTFNPTSCGALAVTGKLVSTQGAEANVSAPFAAASCASLGFKPAFSATTAGHASKAGGASLDVKVTYPSGPFGTYANINSVKVDLPKQLPSRLTTLQKACLAKVFEADPAACPKESDVGTATATTPLLNVPVSGPAYLVSHGGEAFPDLEIVLQGEGVTLILVGNTQIKKGITSSTFKSIPDAPVSGFQLKLPTGKYSILGVNVPAGAGYSLCGQKLAMPTAITGQNGGVVKQTTKVGVSGCARPKKAAKAKAKSNRGQHG